MSTSHLPERPLRCVTGGRRHRRPLPTNELPLLPAPPPFGSASPPMASPLISAGEVEWITSGINFNCRNDGRKRDEYRPLEVRLAVPCGRDGGAPSSAPCLHKVWAMQGWAWLW